MTIARPSSIDMGRNPEVLRLKPLGRIEQQHHHLGKVDRAQAIGDGQLFELVLDLGALAHTGCVDQFDSPPLPLPGHGNGIARDPGLGTGDQPVIARASG